MKDAGAILAQERSAASCHHVAVEIPEDSLRTRRRTRAGAGDGAVGSSPHGQSLAYTCNSEANGTVLFSRSGNAGQVLAVGAGRYYTPTWSPDGAYMAYLVGQQEGPSGGMTCCYRGLPISVVGVNDRDYLTPMHEDSDCIYPADWLILAPIDPGPGSGWVSFKYDLWDEDAPGPGPSNWFTLRGDDDHCDIVPELCSTIFYSAAGADELAGLVNWSTDGLIYDDGLFSDDGDGNEAAVTSPPAGPSRRGGPCSRTSIPTPTPPPRRGRARPS